MASKAQNKMRLDGMEQMVLDLLIEKRNNLLAAWGEEVAKLQRQIEEKRGWPAGEIGTKYFLSDTGEIEEITNEMRMGS